MLRTIVTPWRSLQRADDLPEVAAGDRVETERRLVEEHHLRVGEQGAGDLQAAAHAAAVGPDDIVGALGQPDRGEQRGDPPLGVRHAPQPRVQPQVLGAAEVVVEHAVLEDDADRAPDRDGVGPHVVAADRRLPARRPHQGGEHADRGGLARAVGAQAGRRSPRP